MKSCYRHALTSSNLGMPLLKCKGLRYRLRRVRKATVVISRTQAYIIECGHLRESYVLGGTYEWFLCCSKDGVFQIGATPVAIYENVGFAEVWLAAAVEVLVGAGKLIEIGGGFGSL